MSPRIQKIFAVFPYLDIITTHMQNKNFDYTKLITPRKMFLTHTYSYMLGK